MKKLRLFFALCLLVQPALAEMIDTNSPKTITADKIEYDVKSETIKTIGNTEIVNKSGQRMTLKDSYLSKTGEQLSGDDVKLWLGKNVYLESDNITREGDITIARKAIFTACANCDSFGDAWKMSAGKIVHNKDKKTLKFYNSIFKTYNVPILWFPFFEMPDPSVKHKTGILMPTLNSTNNMGTQINLPLYISISKRHDATFTFSYLTRENPLFQLEHRFNGKHSEFRTNASFTHNREGDNRWHIFNNDVIELGKYTRLSASLERTSDKTYLQKYGFYDAQPYLDSGGTLEIFGQSSYAFAEVHIFQELRSISGHYAAPNGNILPNIRATYQTKPFFKETYAVFDGDVLGVSGSGTASQRFVGNAQIISPWTLFWGNRFTAGLSARYDLYNFFNTDLTDKKDFSGLKNRFLPSGFLEWSLPFFRPSKTWTQVIEPRAKVTFMRHMGNDQFATNNDSAGAILADSTLFTDNRFAGLDLWENGSYADYGIKWATFNTTGNRAEIFLGQSYDFESRKTTDPNSGFHNGASDYVGRVGYNNNKWLNLATRFRLSQNDLSLKHMEITAIVGNSQNYLDIGHIWSQQFIDNYTLGKNINELTAGFGIQLTRRWSVRFNSIYNLTYGEFRQHNGGIFYEHPCYYISAGYRRDNAVKGDYVGNTTFQLRFGISVEGQHY